MDADTSGAQQNKMEVELRALLPTDLRSGIEAKLKKIGATFRGIQQLDDYYYCRSEVRSLDELQMFDVGSYSLRIRKSDCGVELNVKSIVSEGDHGAWRECEVGLSSMSEGHNILNLIGFKRFLSIEKVRAKYELCDIIICLDDISGFGSAIELEIICSPEMVSSARESLRELLSELGISKSSILPKSVTHMVMMQCARL